MNHQDHNPEDAKHVLARGPVATVEACDCGVVHLHLGAVTLRFTESTLNMLQRTLTDACCELMLQGNSPVEALSIRTPGARVTRGLA